jgi:hypothetical protein
MVANEYQLPSKCRIGLGADWIVAEGPVSGRLESDMRNTSNDYDMFTTPCVTHDESLSYSDHNHGSIAET